jgi:Flp pilus assembly pilin Flp
MSAISAFISWATSLLTRLSLVLSPAGGHGPRRLATRRGVTIIEYVLIAVVVIAVAVIFRNTLLNAIGNLVTRVSDFLNGTGGGGGTGG